MNLKNIIKGVVIASKVVTAVDETVRKNKAGKLIDKKGKFVKQDKPKK